MSKASDAARERMNIEHRARVPTIDPAVGVNRAKQGEGIPTAPLDPYNPTGIALKNGSQGKLPETLEASALPASLGESVIQLLQNAGYGTLELVRAATDQELDDISGIGTATVAAIRSATNG